LAEQGGLVTGMPDLEGKQLGMSGVTVPIVQRAH
jgi:hypothetical protein